MPLLHCNEILSRKIIPRCVIQFCVIVFLCARHLRSTCHRRYRWGKYRQRLNMTSNGRNSRLLRALVIRGRRRVASRRSCKFERRTPYSAIVHSIGDTSPQNFVSTEQSILSLGVLNAMAELMMSDRRHFTHNLLNYLWFYHSFLDIFNVLIHKCRAK